MHEAPQGGGKTAGNEMLPQLLTTSAAPQAECCRRGQGLMTAMAML